MSAATAPRRSSRTPHKTDLAVVKTSRRTLRITTVALSFLALLVLFGLVGFQALIVGKQSRIDDLDNRIEEAARLNQRLRVQVAELESPERISVAATAMLGMVTPETVEYLDPIPADELAPVGAVDGDEADS